MVIKRYPYQLWAQTFSGEAIQDNNGNFSATSSVWTQLCPCRDEANSGGTILMLADSSEHVYESLIQLPLYCPDIAINTLIEVRNGGTVRLRASVKQFRRDLLHCRLWV